MNHTQPYQNPVIEQRADPWVYKHTDGYYYFTASVPEYDRLEIRRSKTIQGLAEAEAVVVWRKHAEGPLSQLIWAPEIHFNHGKWYIYFAAAPLDHPVDGTFTHRMYAIENDSANPLEGEWTEKGQIVTAWESFALDATTFEHNGKLYYVWAQRDYDIPGNSNLYISEMQNPWTLKGEQIMLSKPELDWEIIGFKVNEGPAVLKRNGKIFITYSASATDINYCMGLLSADENSDLLNASSWHKSERPVFRSAPENGQYGPGHNSFTRSEDDTQDVLIYHCRNYTEIVGDPLYDPNRHTRAQIFGWNEDGTPAFGIPLPDKGFVRS
ncbi:glycoside hydrolase family 43 protein [Saccharibacillus alkalitolerans]|uniref:Family 43 glycosylhydrolase n=1 Tax=Saccharibacillus alkalitolerans TaxID=2705290 RepID=A0ABX0EZK2_9BACL|nr:family 43 glycosylhydrolase [Saccharibacillus alkalitolerans]NGZ74181.1 family 43 glycosylhydrolase [Saccharibacillus alkalitolerans]